MIFYPHSNKTHFQKKSFALSLLALKSETDHKNRHNHSSQNMNYLIDVLHLWEFNTQHRRDKLIMIFLYIIKLPEIMTASDSRAELKNIFNLLVNY